MKTYLDKFIVFCFLLGTLVLAPVVILAETESPVKANLMLIPDFNSFFDPEYLFIDIVAKPNNQTINAAEVNLNFATDKLALAAIDYDGSFCTLFIPEQIDYINGNVNIQCGRPHGAVDENLPVVRLTFYKLQTGWTKLNLSESRLMSNDKTGTDVLQDAGVYNIMVYKF